MLVTGGARGRCIFARSTRMLTLNTLVTYLDRDIFLTRFLAFVVEQEWESTILITTSACCYGIVASQAIINTFLALICSDI